MQSSLIQSIIKNKKTCYFVSPHFDDAVLSSGALLTFLAKYTDVIVINVFTKAAGKPYSLSAKAYLTQCGYTDAEVLYADRRKEDKLVLGSLAKKVADLGFTDALWREKYRQNFFTQKIGKFLPEFRIIYPTYKFHISRGRIVSADGPTGEALKQSLQEVIKEDGIIFCPGGIGHHVDHILVKNICTTLYRDIIYWSDFPYDQKSAMDLFNTFDQFTFSEALDKKRGLIEGYKTQFTAMFHDGLDLKAETFYTKLTPQQIGK